MVVLNKNEAETTLSTQRFNEILYPYASGTEIISGKEINDLSNITIPARSVFIVDLNR
jgi:hypothetical protein